MPDYQEGLCVLLGNCCDMMEQQFGVDGVKIEEFILEQVNVFIENLEVKVLPDMMGKSVGYMKNIVGFISFIVIMIIAILLMMKDYDRLMGRLKEEKDFKAVREVGNKVIIYIKTFIKAQIIILCIISTVCAVTLAFMGMKGGVLYGILTGFMDMLPFVGTGIMLIPLALQRKLLAGFYLFLPLCSMCPDPGIFRAKADWRACGRVACRNFICRFCRDTVVRCMGNHKRAAVSGHNL